MITKSARDTTMAEVLVEAIEALGLSGHGLLIEDTSGRLHEMLAEEGRSLTRWDRRAREGQKASPFPPQPIPPEGPFDLICIRMPSANEELQMDIHLAHNLLRDEGRLFVYGANDEGIKSVAKKMAASFGGVETLLTKRHCRVWVGTKSGEDLAPATLDTLQQAVRLKTPQGPLKLISYPGLFAQGRLDTGTALLLENLPNLKPEAQVLDYGCGAGTIAAAMKAVSDDTHFTLLDIDALAIYAAQTNVPNENYLVADHLPKDAGTFDLIISNPPIHTGKNQTHAIFAELCKAAPAHLAKKGQLLVVVQKTVPAARLLEPYFKKAECIAESPGFRIWSAIN